MCIEILGQKTLNVGSTTKANSMKWVTLLAMVLASCALPVRGFADDQAGYDRLLRANGISPDPAGIIKFIRPLTNKELTGLVNQLGDAEFAKREQAMRDLANLPLAPLAAIKQAVQSPNAEVRYRARMVLKYAEKHDNKPVMLAALMKMRGTEYRQGLPTLLDFIPQLKDKRLIFAATTAVTHIASEQSAGLLRKALKHEHPQVRMAALKALATVIKQKSIPNLRDLIDEEETEIVRLSAAAELTLLGDRKALITLCEMLKSDDVLIRANALRYLRGITKKKFGYIAYDRSPARQRAFASWLAWAKTMGQTAKLHAFRNSDTTVGQPLVNISVQAMRVLNRAHTATVYCVAFSSDGKQIASAGGDSLVKIWNTETGMLQRTLIGHMGTVRGVAFSPDGKILASSSYDKTIKLWDLKSGKLIRTLQGHTSSVRIIAFSPDGKTLASTSSDKTVRLWDVATGKTKKILDGHAATTRSVAFSPDGETLASSSSDRTICLWDLSTGALRFKLEGHQGSVRSVAFTADSRTLISGSLDKSLRLWDLLTGKERFTMAGHSSSLKSVAVSPDGRMFVSVGNDSRLRVWNADSGKQIRNATGHTSAIWHVAFSPDNKTVASCGSDGSIRIWRINRNL
jgi:hypothetical protein